jgi:hypothetical protein
MYQEKIATLEATVKKLTPPPPNMSTADKDVERKFLLLEDRIKAMSPPQRSPSPMMTPWMNNPHYFTPPSGQQQSPSFIMPYGLPPGYPLPPRFPVPSPNLMQPHATQQQTPQQHSVQQLQLPVHQSMPDFKTPQQDSVHKLQLPFHQPMPDFETPPSASALHPHAFEHSMQPHVMQQQTQMPDFKMPQQDSVHQIQLPVHQQMPYFRTPPSASAWQPHPFQQTTLTKPRMTTPLRHQAYDGKEQQLEWKQHDEDELLRLREIISVTQKNPDSEQSNSPASNYLKQLDVRVFSLERRRATARVQVRLATEILRSASGIRLPRSSTNAMHNVGPTIPSSSSFQVAQQSILSRTTTNATNETPADICASETGSDTSESKTEEAQQEEKTPEPPLPQRQRKSRSTRVRFSTGQFDALLDGGDNADGNTVQVQSAGASPNSDENDETQDTSNQSIDAVIDVDANETEGVTKRIKILRKEYINSLMLPPRLRGRGRKWDAHRLREECERRNIPFRNAGLKQLAVRLSKFVR